MSENITTTKYPFTASKMSDYIKDTLHKDITDFTSSTGIKSGYDNLDAITNLYPGLYLIGAISSLGKTTFVHQMCDQLAQAGTPVLFFSLEQSTLELASKSLARIMYMNNCNDALTSLQIRKQSDLTILGDACNEYAGYADKIHIVECNFSATIADIENYVAEYIKTYNRKPVVVVDYLQVLKAENAKASSREAVEENVARLKKLQSDNKLVLIVISSLNRANYMTVVDYESFKETGGIEYTADVVWGLQLEVLRDAIFDKQGSINEKREKVRIAKAEPARKIELVCLKNRFGISSYSCFFNYIAAHDLFIPDMSRVDANLLESNADRDGFVSIPDGMEIPFKQGV